MPSFSDMKDMYQIQREAKRIKKELKNVHVEAESSGVKVIVSAEQEVIEVIIEDHVERDRIPALIKDATNRAMQKAQLIAAERMQSVMQKMGMGMPDNPLNSAA